jgi:hypothetical protein
MRGRTRDQGRFRRRLIETDAAAGRTLSETRRKIVRPTRDRGARRTLVEICRIGHYWRRHAQPQRPLRCGRGVPMPNAKLTVAT